jgi:hypothetical protein
VDPLENLGAGVVLVGLALAVIFVVALVIKSLVS